MEGHQQAFAMKGERNSRSVPCLRAPCAYNVKSLRVSIVVLCVLVTSFAVWMLNSTDPESPLTSPLARDRLSRPTSNGFSGRVVEGWSRWSELSPIRPTDSRNFAHNIGHKNIATKKTIQEDLRTKGYGERISDIDRTTAGSGVGGDAELKSKKLPSVIIIGVRKGGTRALLTYLSAHPQVVTTKPETHFFDKFYSNGMDWYLSLMPRAKPGQLTVEKTPRYFISKQAPRLIHRMNSTVRLVLILRNPINRVISDYTQMVNKPTYKYRNRTLTELAINLTTREVDRKYNAVRTSTYHLYLARWLRFFPLKQIHIVDGDRLISEPLEELKKLESFLGIPPHFSEDVVYFNATKGFYCVRVNGGQVPNCLGDSKGREHPYVESWVRTKLNDYFYPNNEKLFRMIGRRFEWT